MTKNIIAAERYIYGHFRNRCPLQYIEEKYGFKVHSAYIGQVREKLGIHQHENYHDSHTSPRKPCVCPEEKETAIKEALEHFGFI